MATDAFIDFQKVEYVTSAGVKSTKKLYKKIIEIGDWNMDATANISVPIGAIDYTKVITVDCIIRMDAGGTVYHSPLMRCYDDADPNLISGGIQYWGTNFLLWRRTGGGYDSAIYDATSYNRGWLIIEYTE
jgi:hypothetical protein